MPVIFEGNAGKVIKLDDKVAAGSLSLVSAGDQGDEISYQVHKTIITRLGVSTAGNFQFLHTLGNSVYIYVFGDRMGTITLHGLSFSSACEDNDPQPHGFEQLYAWYKQNRVAVKQAPITVTIGRDTTFQGFVTGLTGDVQDVQSRSVTFQLTLAILPDPAI